MNSSILLRRTAPAAVATLLSLGLLAACGNGDTNASDPLASNPASDPTSAPTSSAAAPTSSAAATSSSPSGATSSALLYWGVDTSVGQRITAESTQLSGEPVTAALGALMTGHPADPDYTNLLPGESLISAEAKAGKEITVQVAGPQFAGAPSGSDAAGDKLAVQQVVYSLNAAAGTAKKPLPVHFVDASGKDSTYLGQPSVAKAGAQLSTLSLMSVYFPSEGTDIDRGVQHFDGVGSSFEANVVWEVQDSSKKVVLNGHTMSAGWQDKLYPWKAAVNLSNLAPGSYTFIAKTDDPSGGEGGGPVVDSRTFTLE